MGWELSPSPPRARPLPRLVVVGGVDELSPLPLVYGLVESLMVVSFPHSTPSSPPSSSPRFSVGGQAGNVRIVWLRPADGNELVAGIQFLDPRPATCRPSTAGWGARPGS